MKTQIGRLRTETVAEVRFEHAYFRKTDFKSRVHLFPDARSRRFGIEIRDVGESLCVVRREQPAGTPGPIRLGVGIAVTDPEFWSYTVWDDPSIESGEPAIRYLNPGVSGGPEFVPRTCPALPLRARRFMHRLSQLSGGLTETTLGALGGPAEVVPVSRAAPRSPEYPVDVRAVESGGCVAVFRFSDGSTDTFRFYANDGFRGAVPGIVLEWDWDPAGGTPLRTRVRFEARATVWRYFLLGIPPGREAAFRIRPVVENGAAIGFGPARPAPLMDGLPPALVLQSEAPIPLSESPAFKVLLESDAEWGGRLLPYPGNQVSRFFDEGGRSVTCSDVFVTV